MATTRKKPVEKRRLALQASLDAEKSASERNRLGQFATPTGLADSVLEYGVSLLGETEKISFLDPAIGTGSFYSALLRAVPKTRIKEALGYEIDAHYGEPASEFWKASGLTLKLADFTHARAGQRFNLLICNPPYVRHHHIENVEKARLQIRTQQTSGMKLSGLAGLYCHFLGLSHAWMVDGGVAGWLIPSEFMDVNYGQEVKRYLLERVTLLHIHRFDPNDVQFADALVSSAVVWFKNEQPPEGHHVKFTFGGSLQKPSKTRMISTKALQSEGKWTRFPASGVRKRSDAPTIADFFKIKRGIATGDNSYFILNEDQIAERGLPMQAFTPILPSPRYLRQDEIRARKDGSPDIERRLFLLDTKLAEEEIRRKLPNLYVYLQEGRERGLHERYLCKHRSLWYGQERRPPTPFVCTYLGRGDAKSGRPFRFILNNSLATVANVFLAMYPTPQLAHAISQNTGLVRQVWQVLNGLTPEELLGEGRVYGGGLHKLEPRELMNVQVPQLAFLLPALERPVKQGDLLADLVA